MKKTLLLGVAMAMLSSCGKHTEPKPLDLQDDDGDQILNFLETSELDKYVANFQQISSKKASLEAKLKTTTGDFKVIEADIHFNKDIKEEITKHAFRYFDSHIIHYDSDYFSEFASAKVQGVNKEIIPHEIIDSGSELQITFESEEMNNDFISIMKKENGSYKEIVSGQVRGKILKLTEMSGLLIGTEILRGDELFFINNSTLKKRSGFFEKSLSEDMKKKTYRFILSTPEETNIYYVSATLSIQAFLDLAKIDLTQYMFREGKEYISLYGESKGIEDRNFLIPMNFHPSSMNAKLTAGMTYGLYANNISKLKDDFFSDMVKRKGKNNRELDKGFEVTFTKNESKELILDLDITQVAYQIINRQKQVRIRGRGCFMDTIEIDYPIETNAYINSLKDLGISFFLDGREIYPLKDNYYSQDGRMIRRLSFNQSGVHLMMRADGAKKDKEIGCIKNTCLELGIQATGFGSCEKEKLSNEISFSVSYQSYIE